jgi:hypothetical protein
MSRIVIHLSGVWYTSSMVIAPSQGTGKETNIEKSLTYINIRNGI